MLSRIKKIFYHLLVSCRSARRDDRIGESRRNYLKDCFQGINEAVVAVHGK